MLLKSLLKNALHARLGDLETGRAGARPYRPSRALDHSYREIGPSYRSQTRVFELLRADSDLDLTCVKNWALDRLRTLWQIEVDWNSEFRGE